MGADPSTYSDEFIRKRVTDGKDKGRARAADQLAAQATQPPHEDDAQALQQLTALSDPNGGWATADAKNYGRMLLRDITGQAPSEYQPAHDGGGVLSSIGHTLGGVLKVAAPIAGMAIPGLGPLLGAGIAAGGSALGGALHGDKFNLGKTALAGLAGGAGQALNVSKLAGLGGGGGTPGAALGPQGIMAPGGGVAGAVTSAPGGAGGLLSKLGGAFAKDPSKILGAGAAGLGFLDARKQQGASNDFNNARLGMLQKQLGMAEQDYAARAPIRNAAYSRLAGMATGPIGSSIYGRAA